MSVIKEYFGKEGRAVDLMDSFEFRPQQIDMGEAVERAFNDGSHLMVEAGTGTGKSLAYLVPAAIWAAKYNKKVVISTYTKTLQQQILNKDIPFMREALGIPFRYALCVGYGNYLSLRRMGRAAQTEMFKESKESRQRQEIFDWSETTRTGDRMELPFEVMANVWEDMGRQKELCMGKKCPTYRDCFYFKARKKWFGSHLLIVNHHLFFANIASGGGVLPQYDAVIFDEAQNIEEAASQFLGMDLSNSGIGFFLDRLYNPRTQKGILTRLESGSSGDTLPRRVVRVQEAAHTFFSEIFETYGFRNRSIRFYEPPPIENHLFIPLKELEDSLKSYGETLQSEEDRLEISSAATRCSEFSQALQFFLHQSLEEFVYWLEISQMRRGSKAVLRGVPIDISAELKRQVFNKTDTVIMTSATLSANGKFDYSKSRLGCDPQEELILDSPFDYPNQSLLYIPKDLPEPSEETEKYIPAISRRIWDLIFASGGRTFVLFTSYDALNRVYKEIEEISAKFPLIKQGEMPAAKMIEEFKKKPSVILATNSFWQGVDVPGEALQSVIITKLPFDVPTDPITEARMESFRKQNKNPFKHYQLPRAIIQLKQGFGRLIRKQTDIGVASILDARLVNRSYGKQFIESLPDSKRTNDLESVKEFFRNNGSTQEEFPPSLGSKAQIVDLDSRR